MALRKPEGTGEKRKGAGKNKRALRPFILGQLEHCITQSNIFSAKFTGHTQKVNIYPILFPETANFLWRTMLNEHEGCGMDLILIGYNTLFADFQNWSFLEFLSSMHHKKLVDSMNEIDIFSEIAKMFILKC